MEFTRRTFLKGFILTAAGLVLPASALAEAEPQRRVWALDSSMLTTARTTEQAQRFTDAVARVYAESAKATEELAKFGLLRAPSPDAIDVFTTVLREELYLPQARRHRPLSGESIARARREALRVLANG